MSDEGKFLIYCLERYGLRHQLSPAAASDLFTATGTDQYLMDHYAALHTVGEEYLLQDLEDYIRQHLPPAGQTVTNQEI